MRLATVTLWLFLGCGRLGFDDQEPGRLVVGSAEDDVDAPGGSLRDALVAAAADPDPNRIVFDPAVFPATITVRSPLEVAGDDTTIDAADAGVVLGVGAGLADGVLVISADRVTVDGLTITGAGATGASAAAIVASRTTGLVVRDVAIDDIAGEGVVVEGCSDATIADGTIEHPIGTPIVVRDSSAVTIARELVVLDAKLGAVAGISLERVTGSHLVDNIVDPGEAFMIALLDSSDNELAGNIVDRGDSGIVLLGTSARNLVIRNVVISPAYDSIYLEGGAESNIVVHNTFYMAGDVVDGGIGTVTGNNLISTTASDFVAPDGYDFHLAAGSPFVDAATDLGYDLCPALPERYLGSAPDLGGVETR